MSSATVEAGVVLWHLSSSPADYRVTMETVGGVPTVRFNCSVEERIVCTIRFKSPEEICLCYFASRNLFCVIFGQIILIYMI